MEAYCSVQNAPGKIIVPFSKEDKNFMEWIGVNNRARVFCGLSFYQMSGLSSGSACGTVPGVSLKFYRIWLRPSSPCAVCISVATQGRCGCHRLGNILKGKRWPGRHS